MGLSIGITRNLSPPKKKKKQQQIFPIFCHSLPFLISLHGYFGGKTYFSESLAYVQQRLNETYGWIVNYVFSNIFTYMWPQNMLCSLSNILAKYFSNGDDCLWVLVVCPAWTANIIYTKIYDPTNQKLHMSGNPK